MNIIENYSLKSLNTFGVQASAGYFARLEKVSELSQLKQWCAQHPDLPVLLLGQGSNLLFVDDYPGLVVQVAVQQRQVIKQEDGAVYLQAGAGENWHEFVRWSIDQGFAGLENLSLIPGTVGAAPMQNIGAYGVELKDVFHELQAYNWKTLESRVFSRAQCHFAYRDSYFKKPQNKHWLITTVTFRLPREPKWAVDYAGVREQLAEQEPSARLISNIIIKLRRSKLPEPKVLGNAGSFFKNPIIKLEQYRSLQALYPQLAAWKVSDGHVKVSAAWLIEQCGWKGWRKGDAGVYQQHALVLVNHGKASGEQLYELAQAIIQSVSERYGIQLEPEPLIIKRMP